MLDDKSVRIIQRKRRELVSEESKVVPPAKTELQNEREMAQAVKSWINELREVKEAARSNSARCLAPFREQLNI